MLEFPRSIMAETSCVRSSMGMESRCYQEPSMPIVVLSKYRVPCNIRRVLYYGIGSTVVAPYSPKIHHCSTTVVFSAFFLFNWITDPIILQAFGYKP